MGDPVSLAQRAHEKKATGRELTCPFLKWGQKSKVPDSSHYCKRVNASCLATRIHAH